MSERSSDDDLIREEEAAAARDAAHIGGTAGDEDLDPAERAVSEGGGGEAEGFELAEEDLIRNASHDDGRGDPIGDAFTPESESDLSGAEYGEADEEDLPDD